jgi:hypothetical protein
MDFMDQVQLMVGYLSIVVSTILAHMVGILLGIASFIGVLLTSVGSLDFMGCRTLF